MSIWGKPGKTTLLVVFVYSEHFHLPFAKVPRKEIPLLVIAIITVGKGYKLIRSPKQYN